MALELPQNLRLRGRIFYARTTYKGKELERSLDTHKLSEARRLLKSALDEMQVDVGSLIVDILRGIGRPCSEQEIIEAWGRLRASRTTPLATDLGKIIVANDKRARRNAKRAAVLARQQSTT